MTKGKVWVWRPPPEFFTQATEDNKEGKSEKHNLHEYHHDQLMGSHLHQKSWKLLEDPIQL